MAKCREKERTLELKGRSRTMQERNGKIDGRTEEGQEMGKVGGMKEKITRGRKEE